MSEAMQQQPAKTRRPGAGRRPRAGTPASHTKAWRFTDAQAALLDAVLKNKRLSDARLYIFENLLRDAEGIGEFQALTQKVREEMLAQFGPDPSTLCPHCGQTSTLLRATKSTIHVRCDQGHTWSIPNK
ncbi:MAG: hypothetical protein IPM54_10380 [Polyangiaceae bacterium]|nr:hypothetical protein [Polyangiaceae bacterium]